VVAVLGLMTGCVATSSTLPGTDEPPTTTTLATGPQQQETGVVVAVDGTLAGIESFSVLLSAGSTIQVTPERGVLFDGGPLSHLRDHLVSGSPIVMVFHQEGDRLIATEVGDAE
jgi:hypothetical protein